METRKKIKIAIISAVILIGLTIVVFIAKNILIQNRMSAGNLGSDLMPVGSRGMSYPLQAPESSIASKSVVSDNSLSEESDPNQNLAETDKKIIKNGNLSLKASKVENAAKDVAQIAKNNGGDVFSSNFYQNANNIKSGTITLKIPNNNFEKTFEEIKKVASLVVRESTNSQDVTEQYIDLESRLKNKQAEEQSYVQILNRASTVDEVLKITRQLSVVRGEIESLQGQKKYLDSQIDMSMITVTLSEDSKITISDSWRPLRVIKDTVNSLLSDIKGFINFVIVLVIRVLPIIVLYLLLVLVLFLIGRKIYRRAKRKKVEDKINI